MRSARSLQWSTPRLQVIRPHIRATGSKHATAMAPRSQSPTRTYPSTARASAAAVGESVVRSSSTVKSAQTIQGLSIIASPYRTQRSRKIRLRATAVPCRFNLHWRRLIRRPSTTVGSLIAHSSSRAATFSFRWIARVSSGLTIMTGPSSTGTPLATELGETEPFWWEETTRSLSAPALSRTIRQKT